MHWPPGPSPSYRYPQADVFISHEGLQLNYEEALTRPAPAPPGAFPGPHSRAGSSATGLSLGGRAEAAPATPVAPPAATAHRVRTPSQELNETASALAAAAHAHALSKAFAAPKVYYNLGEQRQAASVERRDEGGLISGRWV
jgi:hypothetical protein